MLVYLVLVFIRKSETTGTENVTEQMYNLMSLYKVRLSTKELMLSNCGAGEDACESLGLQGDQTSQT